MQDESDDAWIDELPALVRAAATGDRDSVQALLVAGHEPGEADGDGWTALHASAVRGHADVVAHLLRAGAEVAPKSGGLTPLLNAAGPGPSTEAIQLLIDAGADVNTTDERLGWTPLQRAAEWSQPNHVIALLNAGAIVNQPDWGGETALMSAAEAGSQEVVELLIEAGAKVAATVDGETAAEMARRQGHEGLAQFLDDQTKPPTPSEG